MKCLIHQCRDVTEELNIGKSFVNVVMMERGGKRCVVLTCGRNHFCFKGFPERNEYGGGRERDKPISLLQKGRIVDHFHPFLPHLHLNETVFESQTV